MANPVVPPFEDNHGNREFAARASTAGVLRVLIVEDSPDDEELLVVQLERGGYRVVHERVDSATTMRAALERCRWDVVLSDYALPGFSGREALHLVKQMGRDLPFIIVSGTVGEEAAIAGVRNGAHDYVLKSNLARLRPAIERELREAGNRAEQRKIQEQLFISDRVAALGTLAAAVAHEINNPLAAIVANLDLLANDLEACSEELRMRDKLQGVFDELRDAQESADRLQHVVQNLRVFSRVPEDAGSGPVDVKRVLDSSLRIAGNEIRHRARLVKDWQDVPAVHASEPHLAQVFLNLFINAAHAIPEGDAEHNQIHVSTSVDPSGRVLVEIRDTGCGILPRDVPRIFDAFFTTKPNGDGTGLGLSVCHEIVTGLGGEIQAESTVGIGSTFRVLLPAVRQSLRTPDPKNSVPPATRRGRVLVIDDEPVILRAVVRALNHEHEVVAVASADDALRRICGGEQFDLILCDLMMPRMTGAQFHAELARAVPAQAARLVIVTGGAFTADARALLADGTHQRLDKPFGAQQLRAFVNERIR